MIILNATFNFITHTKFSFLFYYASICLKGHNFTSTVCFWCMFFVNYMLASPFFEHGCFRSVVMKEEKKLNFTFGTLAKLN